MQITKETKTIITYNAEDIAKLIDADLQSRGYQSYDVSKRKSWTSRWRMTSSGIAPYEAVVTIVDKGEPLTQ